MGYTRRQILWRVEVPLALPVIMAGVRIAAVTTVGLVTITALIGLGGLGHFILQGLRALLLHRHPRRVRCSRSRWRSPSTALLLAVQRALTPWARSGGRPRRAAGPGTIPGTATDGARTMTVLADGNVFSQAFDWLSDPVNWSWSEGGEIPHRIAQHLTYSGAGGRARLPDRGPRGHADRTHAARRVRRRLRGEPRPGDPVVRDPVDRVPADAVDCRPPSRSRSARARSWSRCSCWRCRRSSRTPTSGSSRSTPTPWRPPAAWA